MLKIEINDTNGRPVTINANRVVVRDSGTNTPLAVAMAFSPGSHIIASVNDADFMRTLRALRINDTVIVDYQTTADSSLPRIG